MITVETWRNGPVRGLGQFNGTKIDLLLSIIIRGRMGFAWRLLQKYKKR
jgi:hypothetical protein